MTEHDKPNPLGLLRGADAAPISDEAEARRRQRIVGRIDELRASLRAEVEPSKAERASGEATNVVRRRVVAWKRAAVVALPLAAAVLLWLQRGNDEQAPLFVVASGEVVVASSDGARTLSRDERWERGDDVHLETDAAQASIVLPSRTSLLLGSRTHATIHRVAREGSADDAHSLEGAPAAAVGEGVRITRGSVQVSASEPTERPVVIVTQQARVVTRGALFAVLVTASPSGSETHVSVDSGEASVLSEGREYRLTAGQVWTSTSNDVGAADGANVSDAPGASAAADAGQGTRAEKTTGTAKGTGSDLAQQNQLFAAAQAARRAGQSNLALRRFDELIGRFPGSEQAHNARVEHFRLLRALGRRDEARRSARVYLSKYPRGFAAAEARELTR